MMVKMTRKGVEEMLVKKLSVITVKGVFDFMNFFTTGIHQSICKPTREMMQKPNTNSSLTTNTYKQLINLKHRARKV